MYYEEGKIMSKYYKISKDDLYELLKAANRYWALDYGGVDNWEWYGDSVQDYIRAYLEDDKDFRKKIHLATEEDGDDIEDISICDIAEYELNKYQEIEGD